MAYPARVFGFNFQSYCSPRLLLAFNDDGSNFSVTGVHYLMCPGQMPHSRTVRNIGFHSVGVFLDDFGLATGDEINGLIRIRMHVVCLSRRHFHLDHSHVLVLE